MALEIVTDAKNYKTFSKGPNQKLMVQKNKK